MFTKKKEQSQEVIDVQPSDLVQAAPISLQEQQKGVLSEEMIRQVALNLNLDREEKDSYSRTEEVISPAVTRFIDLAEKIEGSDEYKFREDAFGNPVDLMGALGNIPPSQMPYIQLSNFNNIWIKLRDGIYLDVYETDSRTGQFKINPDGSPKLMYTKVISIGAVNRKLQLLSNLAYEQNRAKLQAQTMVGNAGGSPLGVGGSWDDTLQLLFGGSNARKK